MKKLIYLSIIVALFAACNQVPTTYAITAPWVGKDPCSTNINGVPYLPDTATYLEVNIPGFVYANITSKTKIDSNKVDSLVTTSSIILSLPTGGGATKASYTADSAHRAYLVTYNETVKDYKKILPEPLKTKAFTTTTSMLPMKIELLENDATHVKGYYYGTLRSVQTIDFDTIRTFTNGYFNTKK
jgi:hypothetical protein